MVNVKTYAQLEHLKAAIFVDAADDAVQKLACLEELPEELRVHFRGVSEVLDGVRSLLCDNSEVFAALSDDSVDGEEVGN